MIIPMIILIQAMKRPKLVKASLLIYCPFLALMLFIRLKVANFSTPTFQEGDNPAGFMDSRLLRTLNFNYIMALNFWLMVLPEWLCYDWAMGCIDLIYSVLDFRILLTGIFWILILFILLKNVRRNSLVFLAVPFLPSSNLLVLVGFVIAERNLYMSVLGYSILISKGIQILFKWRPKLTKIMFVFVLFTFTLRSILRCVLSF